MRIKCGNGLASPSPLFSAHTPLPSQFITKPHSPHLSTAPLHTPHSTGNLHVIMSAPSAPHEPSLVVVQLDNDEPPRQGGRGGEGGGAGEGKQQEQDPMSMNQTVAGFLETGGKPVKATLWGFKMAGKKGGREGGWEGGVGGSKHGGRCVCT